MEIVDQIKNIIDTFIDASKYIKLNAFNNQDEIIIKLLGDMLVGVSSVENTFETMMSDYDLVEVEDILDEIEQLLIQINVEYRNNINQVSTKKIDELNKKCEELSKKYNNLF